MHASASLRFSSFCIILYLYFVHHSMCHTLLRTQWFSRVSSANLFFMKSPFYARKSKAVASVNWRASLAAQPMAAPYSYFVDAARKNNLAAIHSLTEVSGFFAAWLKMSSAYTQKAELFGAPENFVFCAQQ